MKRQKADFFIKRYQLEHIVPLVLTVLSAYFWFNYFQQNLIYYTGLAVNIIGLTIWWLAKISLAENWSAGYGMPKIKILVTHGIYSKICHPLYWGINLTLAGQSLMHQNIILIIPSLIIILYFFKRMRIEDKFLVKELEEKYLDYKKKTWL